MKKKKKQNLKMNCWMKFHAVFTVFLTVFYTTLGMFGGFGMLGDDLKGKYAWAADTTIGVFVDALPGKPILSATTTCMSGSSTVNLSWAGSEGATSYSIMRSGILLASGFQAMAYSDNTVTGGYDFSYVVKASGAGGDSVSDPLIVSAKDCGSVQLPDPIVMLTSLDGKEFLPGDVPVTTKTIFRITGTTNMPNAYIQVKTLPGPFFVSTLQANSNGYWEYDLAEQLGPGSYSFQITATDAGIPSRNVTENYTFQIVKEVVVAPPVIPPSPPIAPVAPTVPASPQINEEDDDGDEDNNRFDDKNKKNPTLAAPTGAVNNGSPKDGSNIPADGQDGKAQENIQQSIVKDIGNITMLLKNKNGKVYQDQDIQIVIFFNDVGELLQSINLSTVDIRYEIINEKGAVVSVIDAAERVFGSQVAKDISVPTDLPKGNYKIRVSLLSGERILTAESPFIYAEAPIVTLGGGLEYTYSQLISHIGWLLILAILLLAFFWFMFLLEYHIFKRAIIMITEDDLVKRGMISHRKEVSP